MPKITQLAVIPEGPRNNLGVAVLDDTGTVWVCGLTLTPPEWKSLPPLPDQPTETPDGP